MSSSDRTPSPPVPSADDYDKMARVRAEWAKRAQREARNVSRRAPSEHFPAAGPEVDRNNALMIARLASRAGEENARAEMLCTLDGYEYPCDWCTLEPDTGPEPTAQVLVTPARFENGHLKQRAVYGYACFEHCRQLHLRPGTSDDARTTVIDREKYVSAARADASKEHKAAQLGMFDDERLHTDPIVNG